MAGISRRNRAVLWVLSVLLLISYVPDRTVTYIAQNTSIFHTHRPSTSRRTLDRQRSCSLADPHQQARKPVYVTFRERLITLFLDRWLLMPGTDSAFIDRCGTSLRQNASLRGSGSAAVIASLSVCVDPASDTAAASPTGSAAQL